MKINLSREDIALRIFMVRFKQYEHTKFISDGMIDKFINTLVMKNIPYLTVINSIHNNNNLYIVNKDKGFYLKDDITYYDLANVQCYFPGNLVIIMNNIYDGLGEE